ncbi:hypothetical protein [Kitasatospora terrestris]|uniref:Uncharacterized protein n=1 Tax=Kitasatospora terrestris TaxID=258051 RepID=A0ABP9DJ82_9ACTN
MSNPPGDGGEYADILVVIGHPFGDVECPLARWTATGPGARPYVAPCRARSRTTGEELPLTVVPLQYRNTPEARRAIRAGLLPNPWPGRWTPPDGPE